MKSTIRALLAIATVTLSAQAAAQVTFYEGDSFQGRPFTIGQRIGNFERNGLNDRPGSVVVVGQRWEACEEVRFEGRCMVLRPGRYPSIGAMGLVSRISSVRPLPANERVADSDYAPMPVVAQDFRRRRNERLFDADVTSVRAVVGTPGQRCWMEREQVVQQQQQQGGLNAPGAVIGAIVGGILGHQVGGGTGKQIATAGGAVGGAALGAQYGRGNSAPQAVIQQDVQRCDGNPVQATPSYWDVTYEFEGQQHRIQMATQPGRTVIVNERGEPRI